MASRKRALYTAVFVLGLAVLACTINVGGPVYPTPTIPVSTEAIGDLHQAVQTAVAGVNAAGEISLVITEPELTSYLAYKLATQDQPFVTNPQVYLRDGQIQIYGTAVQGYFVATANVVVTAGVDDRGQLKVELTSADFGPLSAPKDLKDAVTSAILEAYTGALGPVATGFRLESITIADGTLTIVGKIQ